MAELRTALSRRTGQDLYVGTGWMLDAGFWILVVGHALLLVPATSNGQRATNYSFTSPACTARVTASVRLFTPSLVKIALT